MPMFHAVGIDETGCEFGAEIEAASRADAYDALRERYPEARRFEQVETLEESRAREAELYRHISLGGDYDEDGRPIFHGPAEWDDEDDL